MYIPIQIFVVYFHFLWDVMCSKNDSSQIEMNFKDHPAQCSFPMYCLNPVSFPGDHSETLTKSQLIPTSHQPIHHHQQPPLVHDLFGQPLE